jgi:hypothetical protein
MRGSHALFSTLRRHDKQFESLRFGKARSLDFALAGSRAKTAAPPRLPYYHLVAITNTYAYTGFLVPIAALTESHDRKYASGRH